MQQGSGLTDAGGRLIAQGLQSNCSVTKVSLTIVYFCEEGGPCISDSVKREITQGLQQGHGVDKGVAFAGSCCFSDFENCEKK